MGTSDQGECRQGGTVYGGGAGVRLPRDRHLRIALAVGATGIAVGALLASGVLSGGNGPAGGRWIDPADVRPTGPGGTAAGVGNSPPAGSPVSPGPASPSPSAPAPSGTPTPVASGSPVPSTPPLPGGIRLFRSIASALCLAAPADGTADAYQMACSASPGPRWLPAPVQPDVVTLVSVATGHCLAVDVPDGGDGAPVRQQPCVGGKHQQWRLLPATGGTVADGQTALVNTFSGRCVALPVSPPIGPPLRQTACRGTPDQQWVGQPLS